MSLCCAVVYATYWVEKSLSNSGWRGTDPWESPLNMTLAP